MCGDIQVLAMETLLGRVVELRADILELPHHGSHHELAEVFVDRVGAHVILQSTGRFRWQRERERWSEALAGVELLVTARDGACWVEIDRRGRIRWGRWHEKLSAVSP